MNASAVIDHIVSWLKEYATSAGMKGFVVGISGGIDSAVTSALCARTTLQVLCIEMPIHQPHDQISRARKHIAQLENEFDNVSSVELELTPFFDAFVKAIPAAHGSEINAMPLVNTRARLRMTALYYFAALNSYLVAGTGNKVEDFGIGFFTKYGDGGVDLSPIADLLKTEVYELGEEISIIEEIMEASPTDGLWADDRTDADQIGATYPELEWAMQVDVSQADELTQRQREVLDIFQRMNAANRHKMDPIPVCKIPPELKTI